MPPGYARRTDSATDAARLVEDFAAIENLGAAGKALAARRVAASGVRRQAGERSAVGALLAAAATEGLQGLRAQCRRVTAPPPTRWPATGPSTGPGTAPTKAGGSRVVRGRGDGLRPSGPGR